MKRILIIDDDGQVRVVLRRVLEKSGYEVAEAADGAEGLKAHSRDPVDLVLCDLFMPNKEGLETIRELRREPGSVKIIAMSGGGTCGNSNLLGVAEKMGVHRSLHKPFTMKALVQTVAEVLGG